MILGLSHDIFRVFSMLYADKTVFHQRLLNLISTLKAESFEVSVTHSAHHPENAYVVHPGIRRYSGRQTLSPKLSGVVG